MTLREFHNALRILTSIDRWELEEIGVVKTTGAIIKRHEQWEAFQRDPYRFFIRADNETAEKLWRLIEARQPKPATGRVA